MKNSVLVVKYTSFEALHLDVGLPFVRKGFCKTRAALINTQAIFSALSARFQRDFKAKTRVPGRFLTS